jgi:hypothetical protein
MGEVWRAKDVKLGRDVAIKVLPEEFTKDPERLARFEREARVLASLNHPQIASIYGLEESDGTRFLAMELAEGVDLSERIQRGAVAVAEVIAIAAQIADALEAAHGRGVIHRDLKPANIRLSDDGNVKLLDFGLAKALDAEEGDADLSNSPTMVRAATHAGVILGTAAYMSPEQARGKKVDSRADIWAFGVVLYEMLTGSRLFTGETVSDTLASVLTREVDFSALPAGTPYHVRWLLERCLERDAKMRLRDIGEARVTLLTATPAVAEVVAVAPAARRAGRAAIGGALLLGLLAGGGIAMLLRGRPAPAPVRKVDIRISSGYLVGLAPMISPDGNALLLPTEDALSVRRLDSAEPTALPGTTDARFACWSPDSRQVAFVARGRLWRVALDGTPPVAVASLPEDVSGGGGLAWLPDDRIVIAGSSRVGLFEVSARGGAPAESVKLDPAKDRDFHEVSALPGGRGLLVSAHTIGGTVDRIDVIHDGGRKTLVKIESGRIGSPVYSSSGHIVYSSGTNDPDIWAVAFSLETLEISGEPFLVASQGAAPSIASDGTLSYIRGNRTALRQMLQVDRAGRIERELGRPVTQCEYLDVSPDGRRIVASVIEGVDFDLMVFDLETRTSTMITKGPGTDFAPAWSPDGSRIALEIADRDQIALTSPDTLAEPAVITSGYAPRWWPDGKSIAMVRLGKDGTWDLWRHVLETKLDEPLLATPANEGDPDPSPDGRLVAYSSDETGRAEIFVFDPSSPGSKLQVTFNGGTLPRWSADGTSIYFRQGAALMRVARLPGDRVAFGNAERLFSFEEAGLSARSSRWATFPGGDGFVVLRDVSRGDKQAILALVTNWASELETKR